MMGTEENIKYQCWMFEFVFRLCTDNEEDNRHCFEIIILYQSTLQ